MLLKGVLDNMENKKKVLICGATGFIGRNITEYFNSLMSFEIHATFNLRPHFEQQNITWHRVDLTSPREVENLLNNVKPDFLVQAAATTSGAKDIISRPYIHTTDNAVMNSYLFRSAVEHNVGHVVFFSCTVMYQSSDTAIKESDYDPRVPVHPRYFGVANTKIYLEKMCEFYASLGNTKFTAIRHSNVFGPHDKFDFDRSHFFGANVSKVMTSDGKLVLWGTGEEKRDLIYVSDLNRFVELVFKKQDASYKMYHCGRGKAHCVLEIVQAIIKSSGKEIEIEHDLSKPTIKTSLCLDCTLAEEELGWQIEVPIEEGIEKTISWWRDNIDPITLGLRHASQKLNEQP